MGGKRGGWGGGEGAFSACPRPEVPVAAVGTGVDGGGGWPRAPAPEKPPLVSIFIEKEREEKRGDAHAQL